MHIHVLYIIGKGKALPLRLYDFSMITECQNENTQIWKLHGNLYWTKIKVTLENENQGDLREEQREYCKIRGLLGKSASEIKSELDTVYGENTLPYRTVARWVSYFKKSRSSAKDEAHPSRPVSATSENDVATVQSIVQQDSWYTVEEISDLSGLSSSYVFTILKEKLKLQKICALWIPHLLTPEQKKDRVEKAFVLLSRFKNRDSLSLREVITGDETCFFFFEPDNKLNNKMWVGENNERPVVAHQSRSVRRVM